MKQSSKNGWFSLLKWGVERKWPLSGLECHHAAWAGNLEMLKWDTSMGVRWDEWTCCWAAGKGHLEVLKWLKENGTPFWHWACICAAGGGHLEVLKWLIENGVHCKGITIIDCLDEASKYEHHHVREWIKQNLECPNPLEYY